jgi:hypothetical protein
VTRSLYITLQELRLLVLKARSSTQAAASSCVSRVIWLQKCQHACDGREVDEQSDLPVMEWYLLWCLIRWRAV